MKVRLWWNTVHTGEEMGNTVTTAKGYLLPVPEDGSRTGEITLRLHGNHFAAFAYSDGNMPSEPFDIPLPELRQQTPKTDSERAAEALDRAAMAICRGDKYGEALGAINTAREILRAPHRMGCCCAPCRAKVM